ncbi:alpha-D-ribose 1-methylphosphonate 5-triphosphate diphosphatase [Pseudothauera nasutitermitis]|uniref:Alpha-D-ribose 1-methylphosphonate 5-triphosphate diphosphatase n=1 Tax=Pseudothauera nasutitermitis TaxID=2565930 RepID=A0A4S4AXC0_9RHOO|nr:alpha-D-ribose 1-methylphosphonate 5-triphosphate diphosphatase [Pseudothauera nasutitermitis]THF63945.1 alpha-D-ribose 1-methylphosphonate 5-triphosphate diphosphatase [Pseudothauera nasutitermitis]
MNGNEIILDNAFLVLAEEVVHGHVVLRGGRIAALGRGRSRSPAALDLDGDHLLPGLIDAHTDNAEHHLVPRPGVRWPTLPGVLAHDAAVATAGITTVLDAIACGSDHGKEWRKDIVRDTVEGISQAQAAGHLRADHLLHLRCEVVADDMEESFAAHVDNPLVRLVSVMDHTPGARQFVDLDKFRIYYKGKHGLSDAQVDAMIEQRQRRQGALAPRQRALVAEACRRRGITLATHDDATVAHVDEARACGAAICEFPTTLEAARAANTHGLATILGAPNVVRGASHSGNVSARELAREGLLDMLTSDYIPASLMQAAWMLAEHVGFALPHAVALVSANPARALGLHDRGEIAVGRRADLARVRPTAHGPLVRQVWRLGERVA